MEKSDYEVCDSGEVTVDVLRRVLRWLKVNCTRQHHFLASALRNLDNKIGAPRVHEAEHEIGEDRANQAHLGNESQYEKKRC